MAVRLKSGCTIRDVQQDEIPDVVMLGYEFFHEGNFQNLTFDAVVATEQHLRAFKNPNDYQLGAWTADGKLIGVIEFSRVRQYTVEYIAYLFLFYVTPEWRKSPVGRELLDAAVARCDQEQVARLYVSSTGGLGQARDKLLANLYHKRGFQDLGCFMYRDHPSLSTEQDSEVAA